MVGYYFGEVIGKKEAQNREMKDITDGFTYLFEKNEILLVDSKFLGNEMRFINHSKNKANLLSRNVFCDFQNFVCLFTLREIGEGEELLFDYDGNGTLKNLYNWIEEEEEEDIDKEIEEECSEDDDEDEDEDDIMEQSDDSE